MYSRYVMKEKSTSGSDAQQLTIGEMREDDEGQKLKGKNLDGAFMQLFLYLKILQTETLAVNTQKKCMQLNAWGRNCVVRTGHLKLGWDCTETAFDQSGSINTSAFFQFKKCTENVEEVLVLGGAVYGNILYFM